ncbi:uncharacterized protein LOC143019906 [Oratosquilla oratoria]|uniref:uncharacterized protein LOC143019906 n=1 Tax=Oratosquilla oratoria TaxID=337810 RepID=UPI003F7683EC
MTACEGTDDARRHARTRSRLEKVQGEGLIKRRGCGRRATGGNEATCWRLAGENWSRSSLLERTGPEAACWRRLVPRRLAGEDWFRGNLLERTAWRGELLKMSCPGVNCDLRVARIMNLKLMSDYGGEAWKSYNEVLQKMLSQTQKQLKQLKKEIQELNWSRKSL